MRKIKDPVASQEQWLQLQYNQAFGIYVTLFQMAGGLSTKIKIILGILRLNSASQKECTKWSQISYKHLSPAGCSGGFRLSKVEGIRLGRQSLGCVLVDISMNIHVIVWVYSSPEDTLTHLLCSAVILYLKAKGNLGLKAKFSLEI